MRRRPGAPFETKICLSFLLKKFLSLSIITSLLITTPGGYFYQAFGQLQDIESQAKESLERVFDAKNQPPMKKNSSLPAKGPNQSKAKNLDGKLIAQAHQRGILRNACQGAIGITGGTCGGAVDIPGMKDAPPNSSGSPSNFPATPYQPPSSSNKSQNNSPSRVEWGTALAILGLIGLATGIVMMAVGPAMLASVGLSLTTAFVVMGSSTGLTALGVLLAALPKSKDKHTCVATCNVQQIDEDAECSERVEGSASGPNEESACREAKRNAVRSASPGCYARHCQCSCTKK